MRNLSQSPLVFLVSGFLVFSIVAVNQVALGTNPKWIATYRAEGNTAIGPVVDLEEEGYLIGGNTDPSQLWLMETTKSGKLLWQKTYETEFQSGWSSLVPGNDGGCLLIGNLTTPGDFSQGNALAVKVDERGEIKWSLQFGKSLESGANGADQMAATMPFNYLFYSAEKAHDGGYIASGYYLPEKEMSMSGSGAQAKPETYGILVKISEDGEVEWQKKYGSNGICGFGAVEKTPDGNYVTTGVRRTFSTKSSGAWLVKFDPNGDVIWQKTYRARNSNFQSGKSGGFGFFLDITRAGGFIVSGSTKLVEHGEQKGIRNIWLLKLDKKGEIQWQKVYRVGGIGSITGVQELPRGGFISAGSTDSLSSKGEFQLWLVKFGQDGLVQWEKAYGSSEISSRGKVKNTSRGDLLVYGSMKTTGSDERDGLLMILSKNGTIPGLESTALQANPTDLMTSPASAGVVEGEITSEPVDIPVSNPKITTNEGNVGLDFILKPSE